jgi:DmsE family decaheme c-type cytochrome
MIKRDICLVLLAAAVAWAGQDQKKASAEQAKPAASEASKKKEAVGSETCSGCHDEIHAALKKNAHWILETKVKGRGGEGQSCESCHGPGSIHAETNSAEDIQSPKRMTPAAIDAMCLKCHQNKPTQVGRLTGGHARNQVPCTACHSIHQKGPESLGAKFKTVSGVNAACAGCHPGIWAAFQKPYHHRVPEGAMACTGCHNPHGGSTTWGRNMRMANASDPGCFKCHSDKRGPFLYDHAPVRNEPCTTCHEPHGSINPRMLTRRDVAQLCLECHSNIQTVTNTTAAGGIPPAFHDISNPRYRNCTVCHQKIHGSHANRNLLR